VKEQMLDKIILLAGGDDEDVSFDDLADAFESTR